MLRGEKAAVIYGGGVISGRWPRRSLEREAPAEPIVEALSRDVATMTGKCRRSATISLVYASPALRVERQPLPLLVRVPPERSCR
jgi:hypothetical protein